MIKKTDGKRNKKLIETIEQKITKNKRKTNWINSTQRISHKVVNTSSYAFYLLFSHFNFTACIQYVCTGSSSP